MNTNPIFGTDYDVGWIGFTKAAGLITDGISYGERWERQPEFPQVSHAFICTGRDAGIEAHMETGVARFAISKYAADPTCKLYFRKPARWNPVLGRRIADTAASKLGARYDTALIAADAICDTLLGHWVNVLSGGIFRRATCCLLGHEDRFICSELAAFALDAQPEYSGRGCLVNPTDTIDPQQLFQDAMVFSPGFSSFHA